MDTSKPKRMSDGNRAQIKLIATDAPLQCSCHGNGWAPFHVKALLADGDAVRAELEALRKQCQANYRALADALMWGHDLRGLDLPAPTRDIPAVLEALQQARDMADSLRDEAQRNAMLAANAVAERDRLKREKRDQRPAVDATSAPLRACVPVPAEPELTPEERERLGQEACRLWHGRKDEWCTYDNDDREDWCKIGEALYREGYRAAMAGVWLVQPPAQPSAEPAPVPAQRSCWVGCATRCEECTSAPSPEPAASPSSPAPSGGSAWDDGTGRHVVSKVTRGLVYLWTPSGAIVNVELSDFYDIFRPWKEAEPGPAPTSTPEPQQPATLEERIAALEVSSGPEVIANLHRRCKAAEEETGRIEARLGERVGVLEAEVERVRESAASTREAVRHLTTLLTVRMPCDLVRYARRALGMPETP